jgi:hypothetical protein
MKTRLKACQHHLVGTTAAIAEFLKYFKSQTAKVKFIIGIHHGVCNIQGRSGIGASQTISPGNVALWENIRATSIAKWKTRIIFWVRSGESSYGIRRILVNNIVVVVATVMNIVTAINDSVRRNCYWYWL